MGGLRIDELVKIVTDDVTEHNGIFLVRIPNINRKKPKSFTIHDEYFNIVKQYTLLRPQKSGCSNRFFLTYRNKSCIVQPIGKNTLATMPRKIAEYLGLENPELYTGTFNFSFNHSKVLEIIINHKSSTTDRRNFFMVLLKNLWFDTPVHFLIARDIGTVLTNTRFISPVLAHFTKGAIVNSFVLWHFLILIKKCDLSCSSKISFII